MKFRGLIRARRLESTGLLLLSVIASPALAQQATVSVSSASSVPGGTVSLNVSLASTGGAQPAAVQWTMSYSTSSVTSVSVTAGSSLTAAGKSVTCAPNATGTICVAYGMNLNAISDGILATATFQITPGTLVTSVSVQMTAVLASTAPGLPITGAGVGGTISITQPVSSSAQNSVVFSGAAALQAQGTVGNSAYAGLSQWRVETRIHGLPPTWNGYMEVLSVGNFEIKLLYSTASDRYLYFQDWTGATLGCQVDIGSRTDITLRAQKAVDGTETLRVWDSAGTELTNIGCFGVRPGPDDFRGSIGGYFTIGGTPSSGVFVLQGDMAYFRFFSTSAGATVGEPTDTSSTGDLLDYEFENNLNDSSGKGQVLTSLPSGASFTYVSSGSSGSSGGGGSQTLSLQFQGTAALQAQGTVGDNAYAGLSQWRVETRIHNLPPAWNGYMGVLSVGDFEIKLLYSTASERYLYFHDWTGTTSGCQVDIGSRTDITLRAQKAVDGTETLRVWDSAGTELTNISCFGVRPGPDDFRGSAGSYFTIGGVLQGDMAYFRFFSTSAAATVGEPTDTSSTGDLLDYEFENNLNDSSGNGQVLTSLPSGASFTYVPSGSSGSSGGGSQTLSVQFQGTAALQAQGTVSNSAYAGLSQWRVETRIYNLPPTWNGYMEVLSVGNFEIKLLYSTASDRYLYLQDWTGATSGCQVDIGSRTDITLRAQKAVDGTETLRVWDSAGTELTNNGCWGVRPGPDDFSGSTGAYFTIGGSTYSGLYVLQGDMSYFRLFSTSAAPTVGEPTDTSSTGDLLDYEFQSNLNDSSGKGQVLTSFPLGGSFNYQ